MDSPQRTLAGILDRIQKVQPNAANADPSTQKPHIESLPIDAVNGGGLYTVQGRVIPASGNASLEAGELVPVAFKNGQPWVIVAHNARRAQFAPPVGAVLAGAVEMLFISTNPATAKTDVFFRNIDQVTALNLDALLPGIIPTAVRWGDDTKNFLVFNDVAKHVYVFTLNRTPNKTLQPQQKAKATLSQQIDLTTIESYFTATVEFIGGPSYSFPFQPFMADFTAFFSAFGGGYNVLVQSNSITPFFDLVLDERGHLLVVLNLNATATPAGFPTVSYDPLDHVNVGVVDATARVVLTNIPAEVGTNFPNVDTRTIIRDLLILKADKGQIVRRMDGLETHFPGLPGRNFKETISGAGIVTLVVSDVLDAVAPNAGLIDWNFRRIVWQTPNVDHDFSVKMTDLVTGATAVIDAAGVVSPGGYGWRNRYKLLHPDFLYDYDEADLFMLAAWDRKTGSITLDAAKPGFPKVFDDKPMDDIVRLKKLPANIALPGPSFYQIKVSLQFINDKTVLSPVGRFFKEA
jgi:hypothetical protein